MNKWTRKYLKLARTVADDNKACYSRKIGVFLATPDGSPLPFGYNGSISGAPHNDTKEHLSFLYDTMLTDEDKELLLNLHRINDRNEFLEKFTGCETCPRRLLNIPSGERLDLCNCSHSERNAIFNAARRGIATDGAYMYCYCGVPCHECAIAIIQSGIAKVFCLKTDFPDYSSSSRYLLASVGVELEIIDPEDIDKED